MTSQLSPLGRFERLLVATDGSEFSAGALRIALALAGKCGASLTAMTMVVSNPELDTLAPQLVEKAERDARQVLDEVGEQAKAQGIPCETVLRHGDTPDQEIVAQAEGSQADVVIMGRRGRRGLARMMVGDATAKVIGHGHCSVLVVPKASQMWTRGIVLGTDGSRYSDSAAVAASRLAKMCGLPVTVVSATLPSHSRARKEEAVAAVERLKEALAADGVTVEGRVAEGRPDAVIVEGAREAGADLIVVGSHGRTGLQKLLMGSVSERVIGSAVGPVLVVKGG